MPTVFDKIHDSKSLMNALETEGDLFRRGLLRTYCMTKNNIPKCKVCKAICDRMKVKVSSMDFSNSCFPVSIWINIVLFLSIQRKMIPVPRIFACNWKIYSVSQPRKHKHENICILQYSINNILHFISVAVWCSTKKVNLFAIFFVMKFVKLRK